MFFVSCAVEAENSDENPKNGLMFLTKKRVRAKNLQPAKHEHWRKKISFIAFLLQLEGRKEEQHWKIITNPINRQTHKAAYQLTRIDGPLTPHYFIATEMINLNPTLPALRKNLRKFICAFQAARLKVEQHL